VVLVNFSLFCFGLYVLNNDSEHSYVLGCTYVWVGLSCVCVAVAAGPLPVAPAKVVNHAYFQRYFHEEWENILCCGRKRRGVMLFYIVCISLSCFYKIISLTILAQEHKSFIPDPSDPSDKEAMAMSLFSENGGLFVAIATILLEFGTAITATVYRKSLTRRYMIDNRNVLYGDGELSQNAAMAWEIKPEELQFGRKIGEGYFGEVFLAGMCEVHLLLAVTSVKPQSHL
jgi:hypothetical protein